MLAVMAEIKGFLETSFVDWPGRVCAVIFLAGCNFRCPFCHNHPLVVAPDTLPSYSFEEVRQCLTRLKKWLGGICISGGEPTMTAGLAALLGRLKNEGWQLKLDTNGSRPRLLAELLAGGLLDMVSMDVKAPLDQEKYSRCAGTPVDLQRIRASIALLRGSGVEHEFRMTVVPRFHSAADIRQWAAALGDEGGRHPSRLKLQNFNPRTTLDPVLAGEKPFPAAAFADLQKIVANRGLAPAAVARG